MSLKAIKLRASKKEPGVILDRENSVFEISGRSIPENAVSFYAPLKIWISEYIQNPNELTIFTLKLEYLNSSSTKQLLKMLVELEMIKKQDKEIRIVWQYESNDDIIRERGEELESVLCLPFEYKPY